MKIQNDKIKHIIASLIIYIVSFFIFAFATDMNYDMCILSSIMISFICVWCKETIYDVIVPGHESSLGDIVADVIGIIIGVVISIGIPSSIVDAF